MTTPAHPGGDYYVSVTGTIQAQANPVLADGLKALGWSGPYTWTQAKSVANNVAKRTLQGGANYFAAGTDPAVTGAADAAQNAAGAAKSAIPNAFQLVFGNTTGLLTRILKVGLGGVLIIAGIMRMTGAKRDILQIAGTAAKGAML